MTTALDFTLEPWREEFAEGVAAYASNAKIANNLRNNFPHPYSLEDAKGYVALCMRGERHRELTRAIVVDGKCVGSIGVFFKDDVYCKNGEIGYWLGEPFWGNHIASRAIVRICDEVFGNHDIFRIYAQPFAHNIGSRKALERAGFVLEGVLKKNVYKNGGFYDSCLYAKFRNDNWEKVSTK